MNQKSLKKKTLTKMRVKSKKTNSSRKSKGFKVHAKQSKAKQNQVKKTALFHKVLSVLKKENIKNQKLLVAVSGGADSLCLLHLLKQCAFVQNLNLFAVHVHHGLASTNKIKKYRDATQNFTSRFAKKQDLDLFQMGPAKKLLKNEDQAREYRYNEFKKLMKQQDIPTIALAHNENDVLETKLIHLIRGCSHKGLKSLKTHKPPYLRPLLQVSRKEILEYLKLQKIKFMEDPTNKEDYFLRNWIRLTWLPLLEKKRPGSLSVLARSLSQISLNEPEMPYSKLITPKGLRRDLFLELSPSLKKQILAYYMRKNACKDYGQSHINEIIKQLDRNEKIFNLRVLKKTWKMGEQFISVETKK